MITHLHQSLTGANAFQDGVQAYRAVLSTILQEGLEAGPRGMRTLELTDATICIENASRAVPLSARALINKHIGATEYTQLLAGVSFLEQLDAASNGKFSQFADDGKLRGAYGPRVYRQLPAVADILFKDPASRQAVIMINRGVTEAGSRDVPCTLGLQFKVRDDHLNLTVMMRSSDAWLGIPYDWWQFSRLQMTMAWALEIEPGTFTFFAGSLHLYDRNLDSARATLSGVLNQADAIQPPAFPEQGYIPEQGMVTPAMRISLAQQAALKAVFHQEIVPTWNGVTVPEVEGDWIVCHACRYVVRRDDRCPDCQTG